MYGFSAGAPFSTELMVLKQGGGGFLGLFGSRKPAIRLGFQDQAEGPATRLSRAVTLDRLSPGKYELLLVVKDATGEARQSRAAFEVIP